MPKLKRSTSRDWCGLWLSVLVLCGGCSSGGGDSPDASGPVSLGFANDDSDVVAVLPDGPTDYCTVVIMRADGSRGRDVAFVHTGLTEVELIADSDGRVGELWVEGDHFVFSNYTATQVTVTHDLLGGDPDETWQQDLAGSVAKQSQALSEQEREADQEVDDTLKWVADASNTYLPLIVHRKLGETLVSRFEKVRAQLETLRSHATKLALVVGNELKCATQKRTGCAVQVAEQAQTLAKELHAVDPDAKTTAGFTVEIGHIRAIRDDWDPLIVNGQISTDFTLKDVPCSESVFAELNPDCPQYVAPGHSSMDQDAGSSDAGTDMSETTRLCEQKLSGGQFKLNCKMATYGTCEDSGWIFFGTYDSVLACGSDVAATAEQIQSGDLSKGPNSNEVTGKGGGGGGTGCFSGTWQTPACGTKAQKLTFNSDGTGSYSNPDCNDICTDLIFPFEYTVTADSVTLHYTEVLQQPSCMIDNPPTLMKPATDDTFTFTCAGGTLSTTSATGTTTYMR